MHTVTAVIYVDLGQMQNFIRVVHYIGREDLVTHLQLVGTALAPLIYDLPSDAGCELLVGRCNGVLKALEDTSNLIKLTVSANLNKLCTASQHRVRSCSITCEHLSAKSILTFLHRWQMNLHKQSWHRTFHTIKTIWFETKRW